MTRVFLPPCICGSAASLRRSRSIGPSGSHSVDGNPRTSTNRRLSSSARAGVFVDLIERQEAQVTHCVERLARRRVLFGAQRAGVERWDVRNARYRWSYRDRTGSCWMSTSASTAPEVELHQSANAYSCSVVVKDHRGPCDRPPRHLRSVIETTRDWELNRRSRL